MANNIEDRIVQMKFDNAQFEQGIKTSMSSLEKFDKSLQSKEGTKGLSEISKGIESVTNVSAGLIAKFTIVSNLVNGMVNSAKNFVKAITIDPIKTGLNEYELKMGSVQTIMMGTGESLDTVMDKLEELNRYADRTIYSFQDMTSNIGKFTNAGVKLDVATKAIQGVSNLAAVSGAGATEASRAMYNISQALGTGYMQLIDWKSIENANMATMEFKQTLIDTAKEMGVLSEASNVTAENFRETLSDKWLTNDVLLNTLQKYTDETTELGKKAFAAATEIKTASQLLDVMKESVQSGWATTWELIIGNFEEAKQLFTGIGQVFDLFAGRSADARNSVLKDWNELGGRKHIIQSLYNLLANILLIIKPFKEAFRNVFPEITGQSLANITKKLADFTGKIWISKDAAEGLKNILTLLLTPIRMVINGIKGAAEIVKLAATLVWLLAQRFLALFKSMDNVKSIVNKIFDPRFTEIGKQILELVTNLGGALLTLVGYLFDFLNAIGLFNTKSGVLGTVLSFLNGIKDITLNGIISGLKLLNNLLKGMTLPKLSIDKVIGTLGDGVTFLINKIIDLKNKFKEFIAESGGIIGILSKIGSAIASIFTPMTAYAKELDGAEGTLSEVGEKVGEVDGALESLSKTTEIITKPVSAFSKALKSLNIPIDSIKKGIITFGNKLKDTLSNLSPAKVLIIGFGLALLGLVTSISKLNKSLTNITDNFGIGVKKVLKSTAKVVTNFGNLLKQLKSTIRGVGRSIAFERYTAGLKNLAIAVGILAASFLGLTLAFKYLKVEWQDIAKGAVTVGLLTAAIVGLTVAFTKLDVNGNVMKNALVLSGLVLALSISMKVLANAFNSLNYSLGEADVAEGKIIIMASLIGGLTLAMIALSKWSSKIEVGALSIISMAVALRLMVGAFNAFSKVEQVKFENVIAISGMMVAAAIMFAGLSKFSIKAAVGIGLFTSSLLLVPLAVAAIENILVKDPMALLSNFMMVMDGLLVFMLASLVAGKNIAKAGIGILAAVSSLIVVARAIKVLSDIPSEDISKAAPVIAGILVVYGLITALSKFAGKEAIKAGIAIQLMSIALVGVVGAIALMTLLYDEFDPAVVNRAVLSVGGLLLVFGALTALTKFAGGVGSITAIIVGVGLLLTATALLTLIPTDELMAVTKSLMQIMGMFAVVMLASSKINWKGALAMTVPLIAIVGAFFLASKYMGNVDWKNMLAMAIGMKLVASAIANASVEVSKISIGKNIIKKLGVFIGVAATLTLVAIALGKFAQEFMNVNPTNMIASMSSLSLLAIAMGETAVILSKAKFTNLKKVGQDLLAFVGIAATMSTVAIVLGKLGKEFMTLPISQLIAGATALSVMSVSFASTAVILSKAKFTNLKKVGQDLLAFVGIAVTMSLVASVLGKFGSEFMNLPFSKLIGGALSLSIMANAFAAATMIISKVKFSNWNKLATSLAAFVGVATAMSIAINIMAPALIKMADLPWSTLITSSVAITIMANGLALATGLLSLFANTIGKNVVGMITGAAAMIAVAAACRILAPALSEISEIPFGSLVLGLVGLAGALGVLGVAGYTFGTFATQMALGTLIIGGLALVLNAVFVPALEKLSKIDFNNLMYGLAGMGVAILGLGAAVGVLGAVLSTGIGAVIIGGGLLVLAGFAAVLALLAGALSLVSASLVGFSGALNAIITPLQTLSSMDLLSLAGQTTSLALAFGVLAVAGLALIAGAVGILAAAAALGVFAIAILALEGVLASAEILMGMFDVGAEFISNIIDGIGSGIGDMYNAAKDAVAGFLNGAAEGISSLWNSGVELARSFIGGFRSADGLNSHSPAWEMILAAYDAVAGWLKGTDETKNDYANSGKEVASEAVKGADTVVKKEMPGVAKDATKAYTKTMKQQNKEYRKIGNSTAEEHAEGIKERKQMIEDAGEQNALSGIQGIVNGMKEKYPWLADKLDSLNTAIGDKLGSGLSQINLSDSIQALIERSGVTELFDIFGVLGDATGTEALSSLGDLSSQLDSIGGSGGGGGGASSAIEEVTDSIEEMKNSIEGAIDIFSEFDSTVDISVNDMLLNMKSQLDGVDKWSRDLANLTAMGFNEAFVQKLAEQGTGSYKYVEALQSASKAQILAYNIMFDQSTKSANAAIEFVKEALPELTEQVSKDTKKTIEEVGHLKGSEEELAKATDKATESTEDFDDAVKDETSLSKAVVTQIMLQQQGITDLTQATNEQVDATKNVNENASETVDVLSKVIDGTSEATENLDGATTSTEDLGNAFEMTEKQAMDFVLGMAKIESELDNMKASLKETIEGQISIFEKFDTESKISKDELLENMKSQIDGINNWANNINKLVDRGIDEGLLQHLREMGPEGSQYVQAFLEMTDSELQKAGDMYEESLVLPDQTAQMMVDKMRESGQYSVQGLLEGIMGMQESVAEAGTITADSYNEAYKAAEGIHSPSEVQFNNGMNDAIGLINGLKSKLGDIRTTAVQLANTVKNNLEYHCNYQIMFSMGSNIGQGLVDGIRSKIEAVKAAAAELASAASEAVSTTLQIKSPSRVAMGIGEYFDLGFIKGIDNYSDAVEESSKNLGTSAIDSMRDTISKLNDYAMSDIEDPVIRPVLDLSEIQNGAKKANNLLSNGIQATSSIANDTFRTINAVNSNRYNSNDPNNMNTSNGATYNFTQNNYSPKALDRIEIYRQTNNQFSQMKGLVEGV